MKLSKQKLARITLLFVIVFIANIGQVSAEQFTGGVKQAEIEKSLLEVTNIINKTLPKMIDSDIRLENVTGAGGAFNYKYTLVKYSIEEINIEALKSGLRPNLLNNLCTNPTTEFARRYDIPMVYSFFGKNGKYVTTIKISPSECNIINENNEQISSESGVFNKILSAGIGGFASALVMIIFIGVILLMKKVYFRSFRKFDGIISEGKLAFSNNLIPNENPYNDDEKERKDAWLKGWVQAKKSREKWKKNHN